MAQRTLDRDAMGHLPPQQMWNPALTIERRAYRIYQRRLTPWKPIDGLAKTGDPVWAWGPHIGTDCLCWEEDSPHTFQGYSCHWHSAREGAYIQDRAVTMYMALPEGPCSVDRS